MPRNLSYFLLFCHRKLINFIITSIELRNTNFNIRSMKLNLNIIFLSFFYFINTSFSSLIHFYLWLSLTIMYILRNTLLIHFFLLISRYCATWAADDECKKNPGWMLKNCPVACKECDNKCADHEPFCNEWKKNKECTRNPEYMNIYCARSCGKCKVGGAIQDFLGISKQRSVFVIQIRGKMLLCSPWSRQHGNNYNSIKIKFETSPGVSKNKIWDIFGNFDHNLKLKKRL